MERERAEKAAAEAERQRKANLTAADFQGDPKGLSEWYKEKGNTFYKNKEFDQAVEWYTKVIRPKDDVGEWLGRSEWVVICRRSRLIQPTLQS